MWPACLLLASILFLFPYLHCPDWSYVPWNYKHIYHRVSKSNRARSHHGSWRLFDDPLTLDGSLCEVSASGKEPRKHGSGRDLELLSRFHPKLYGFRYFLLLVFLIFFWEKGSIPKNKMRHNYTLWKIMCPICNIKDDTLSFKCPASVVPTLFACSALRRWALKLREGSLILWWFSSSSAHLAKEHEPYCERASQCLLQ